MKTALTRRDMVKWAAAGTLAAAASARGGEAAPPSEAEILARRAARFHQAALDVAMGPGGMLVSFLRYDTRKPFQEGGPIPAYAVDALEDAWVREHPTAAEWLYGENTLWATGWFLYSQILRYRATGEPEARATAQKCFRDLSNIFRLSWAIEPGLLGKPHGGRAGPTTSFDQSACPVLYYVLYARELGTPEEKAEAARYMAQHGEYYLRHKWIMNHFGHFQNALTRGGASTMKYVACVYAAYEMTGEKRFRDAALEQMRVLIRAGKLPWPTRLYETNHNLFYYSLLCDYWSRTEIGSECDWKGCVREYWTAARSSFDPGGLPRLGMYDTKERSFHPNAPAWTPGRARSWKSPTLFSNGGLIRACDAGLALLAQSHGWDPAGADAARRILLRMDESSLRWFWGEDPSFPAEMRPALNIFATEVAGVWQIAYWLGRLQKAW